jgi:hypothetical protein
MKNLLLVSVLMLGFNGYGQGRTSSEEFLIKNERALTSVVGWKQDGNGEWSSRKNQIDYKDKLISIGTFNTIIDSVEYTILKTERHTHYYKYPSISTGYVSTKTTCLYIINVDQLDLLKNILKQQSDSTYQIDIEYYTELSNRFIALGGEYTYSTNNVLKKLAKKVREANYGYLNLRFPISSQLIDGKYVVRFDYPSGWINERKYNKTLKKGYFETTPENFTEIL